MGIDWGNLIVHMLTLTDVVVVEGRVLLWVAAEDTVLVVGVQVEVRGGVRCAQKAAVSAPRRAADGGVARHAQAAALQVEEQLPGVAGRGERPPVVHRRGAVIAAGQRVLGQRHQVQEVRPGLCLVCIICSYCSSSCCYKAQHQAESIGHGQCVMLMFHRMTYTYSLKL